MVARTAGARRIGYDPKFMRNLTPPGLAPVLALGLFLSAAGPAAALPNATLPSTFWQPIVTLNGANPFTNAWRAPFLDPGAAVSARPRALAAGDLHSLALKADGVVVGWGDNTDGQTSIPANATNVLVIAAGANHSLALKADGTITGWGDNTSGQTTIPASATNGVSVAAGIGHSLALRADATVIGWGDNAYGQTTIPPNASNVVAIAAGDIHSLALKSDGSVIGWGWNGFGQTTSPGNAVNVIAIAAGGYHSLALRADGTVVAWGWNGYGQTSVPVGATNVTAIAAGGYHSLALRADGTVVGWGDNTYGQITIPAGATNVVAITAGNTHSLALKADGSVIGWGGNSAGQITVPNGLTGVTLAILVSGALDINVPGTYFLTYTATNSAGGVGNATRTVVVGFPPAPVVTTLPVAGVSNTVATLNGAVNPNGVPTTVWFEWGAGDVFNQRTAGVVVGQGSNATAVAIALSGVTAGRSYHFRAVASNNVGQVVRGAARRFEAPMITLTGGSRITNAWPSPFVDPGAAVGAAPGGIAAGGSHSLALKADGTVVGWGLSSQQQTVAPTNNVTSVAAGTSHSLVLQANGRVVGGGDDTYGQSSAPTDATNVVGMAAGAYHSLAVRVDGTVIGWGLNSLGQTTIPAGATSVVAVAAGGSHSLALKTDGTVLGWGLNGSGQITIPAAATNVVGIAAGTNHSLALKADGTVVAWGNNSSGQTTIPTSATNVVAIAAGSSFSLALKSDGTVIGWGQNANGQTTIPAGATNVVALAAGAAHSLAIKADGAIVGWGAGTVTNGVNSNYGQSIVPAGLTALNAVITISGTVNSALPGNYSLTYSTVIPVGAIGSATRTVFVGVFPIVTTLPAGGVIDASAVLNGAVNANGVPTSVWFEWGTGRSITQTTPVVAVGNGTSAAPFSTGVTGVVGGPGYIFRSVASNTLGLVVRGADARFHAPLITLNGPNPLTNAWLTPFVDPGAVASEFSDAVAAGGNHSLALKADGRVVGWGLSNQGQTNVPVNATNVVAIAAGTAHSLALRAGGSVVGWGDNGFGQTAVPASVSNVVAIVAGGYHNVAVRANGTVVAWGLNSVGQATPPSGLTDVVAVAAGAAHSLALKKDGSLVGWGQNSLGQITIPASAFNIIAIAAGSVHSVALKSDRTVVAWGNNGSGQITIPAGATNVIAVACGDSHSLALKADGTVVAWGNNSLGQSTVPAGLTNVIAIAGGSGHSLALKSDGTIVAWGAGKTTTGLNSNFGQSIIPPGLSNVGLILTVTGAVNPAVPGLYTITYATTNSFGGVNHAVRLVYVAFPPAPSVLTLSASGVSNSVATLNGTVNPNAVPTSVWFEWGAGGFYDQTTTTLSLGGGTSVVAINASLNGLTPGAAYHYRLVALNSVGQMVRGAEMRFSAPLISLNGGSPLTNAWGVSFVDPGVRVISSPTAIAAGAFHSLAIKADGTVVGWGLGGSGQTNSPLSASPAIGISGGYAYSLAIRSNRTVAGWGDNTYGQSTAPASATNVVAVAAGGYHGLAVRANGTMVGWGLNSLGQATVPANATNVVAAAAGVAHSLALRSDGTVVGWGLNSSGQATIPASATNVVAIAAGGIHSLALRADGTVVAWGNSGLGQATVPAAATNVIAIAGGDSHSLALKADGTVIGWGNNYSGEITIPAGAINVVNLAAGSTHSLALKADGTVIAWGAGTIDTGKDSNYGQSIIPANLDRLGVIPISFGFANANLPGVYTVRYSVTNFSGAIGTTTRSVVVTFPSAPLAVTLPPGGVNNSVATLNGAMNPKGVPTLFWFEWGAGTRFDQTTPASSAGSGIGPVNISATLGGLIPGLGYRYRLVASNSVGQVARASEVLVESPLITLVGSDPLTNAWTVSFVDPGATITGSPGVIGAGTLHSLALKADGTVVGWGDNTFGQSNILASATNVVAVGVGGYHNLAVRDNGTVVAWGLNNQGQTTVPAAATNGIAAAAGAAHSLVLRIDGTVVGWGGNGSGQATVPAGATNVSAIAAGSSHSLALKNDGGVVGWGNNSSGQVTIPAGATNVVAIAGGAFHSLALRADGTVVAWGLNSSGQTDVPVSATNVVAIAAGGRHSLALRADGTVVGWGLNGNGQITMPTTATNVVAIAAGDSHSLALRDDGTVLAWGSNGNRQTIIPPGLKTLNLGITVSGAVNPNVPGLYTRTYSGTTSLGAIGSAARTVIVLQPPAPPRLSNLTVLGNGAFRFAFSSPNPGVGVTGASFLVLASDDIGRPLSQWTVLGAAIETPAGSGLFQFTDPQAALFPKRFYQVRVP